MFNIILNIFNEKQSSHKLNDKVVQGYDAEFYMVIQYTYYIYIYVCML